MINIITETRERSSAAMIESHTPSSFRKIGRIITAKTWKRSVLKNDIIAETNPSLSAVKNDEPNMLNPANRKEKQYMVNPLTVISKSSLS